MKRLKAHTAYGKLGYIILLLALLMSIVSFFQVFTNLSKATTHIITTTPIEFFHIGSSSTKAGNLEFIGGLEIESDLEGFGGFSGLRLTKDGSRLFAISDTAKWLSAEITRDENLAITGLKNLTHACLCRKNGSRYSSKHWGDSEGLEISGNTAWVSFERLNRINSYKIDSVFSPGPPTSVGPTFKQFNISYNAGLEALALAPKGSPIEGKLVTITEESLDDDQNHRAFIIEGDQTAEFSITRSDDYNITDATFLPNGDLIILERRYGLSVGLDMRIRRFQSNAIKPSTLLSGEILMEAGLTSRIDNMEGISAWQTSKGQTRLAIISDDNFASYQRTLLLEFALSE